MEIGGGGGAFGGGKAGAPFDIVAFVKKPQVGLRFVCLIFAILVFGCISSEGWRYDARKKRETCLYNDDGNACNYGVGVGVVAFLAAIAFLAGEYLFEQMSSVKTRKHYVLSDLAFSGFWSFLYFVGFCYLWNSWSKAEEPPAGVGISNVRAAIIFSFFSIFTWGGCGYFAYMRWRAGTDGAFGPMIGSGGYEVDSGAMPGATAYASFPGGLDSNQYQQQPFNSQPTATNKSGNDYSSPNY